jgi:hypothetical protein
MVCYPPDSANGRLLARQAVVGFDMGGDVVAFRDWRSVAFGYRGERRRLSNGSTTNDSGGRGTTGQGCGLQKPSTPSLCFFLTHCLSPHTSQIHMHNASTVPVRVLEVALPALVDSLAKFIAGLLPRHQTGIER